MKILNKFFLIFLFIMPIYASAESIGSSTGYKLPRFVSIKSDAFQSFHTHILQGTTLHSNSLRHTLHRG